MDEADMIFKPSPTDQSGAAALVDGPAFESRAGQFDFSTDEADTEMSRSDMGMKTGALSEFLAAALVAALVNPAVFDRLARMMHLDVKVQLPACRALVVAEDAVLMLLLDVGVEQRLADEPNALNGAVLCRRTLTLTTPKPNLTVSPVKMSTEPGLMVERFCTSRVRTLVGRDVQMLLSVMFVKRLFLSEALTAIDAAEAIGSLVNRLMTS